MTLYQVLKLYEQRIKVMACQEEPGSNKTASGVIHEHSTWTLRKAFFTSKMAYGFLRLA